MSPAPFAWPGGKRALTKTLLSLIPSDHTLYVEVFCGSAKLLFAKDPSQAEVMNDVNDEVTNFFRVAKHRTAALADRLELECLHAGRFRELRTSPAPACEVDRALRFAYLTWYSFGAKGEHFAQCSAREPSRKPLTRVRELLASTAARLAAVQIEQQDFATILQRYDSADSFFYLDPPYVDFQDNGRYAPMDEARREEMFKLLAGLKGRFLLSFDDHPEIRRRAKQHGFLTRQEKVPYTLSSKASARTKASELLVANYPIAA